MPKENIVQPENPETPRPVVEENSAIPKKKKFSNMMWLVTGLVLLIILGASGYFLLAGKTTQPSSETVVTGTPTPTISAAKGTKISDSIASTLPKISSDGKPISRFYLSDNSNYLVFSTYVKPAGAGPEDDFWLLNRATKEQINLSNLIKKDPVYKTKYETGTDFNDLHLVFYDLWRLNNPVFSVADFSTVKDKYWEYDIKTGIFNYFTN